MAMVSEIVLDGDGGCVTSQSYKGDLLLMPRLT